MYSKTITILAAVLAISACSFSGSSIRRSTPDRQGMNGAYLSLIDSAVNASIADGEIPGAVVGVVRNGKLVYEKAFGNKAVYPEVEPMTVETMFDLASVSKCVGTTLSVMQLVEQGKLRLVDTVAHYIPGFLPWVNPDTGERVPITVQHLLTHSSGLEAYLPDVNAYLEEFGPGTPDSLMMVISTRIQRCFRPGTRQLYSCLNFITLQNILERITGERLCDYAQKNVFDALGLKHTCYFPLALDGGVFPLANKKADARGNTPAIPATEEDDRLSGTSAPKFVTAAEEGNGFCGTSALKLVTENPLASEVAPTEMQENGSVLRGQVHDPTARLINLGNSGNAGVFSNVEDLAVICATLLGNGSFQGRRILSPLTVRRMFEVPQGNAPRVARALGWDCYYLEPYTSGDVFPVTSIRGHTGYTGTSIILDPETDTAVIVLAHRVHPHDEGSTSRLRSIIASVVAASIGR